MTSLMSLRQIPQVHSFLPAIAAIAAAFLGTTLPLSQITMLVSALVLPRSWSRTPRATGDVDRLGRLADALEIRPADLADGAATSGPITESLRQLAASARRRYGGEEWRAFLAAASTSQLREQA